MGFAPFPSPFFAELVMPKIFAQDPADVAAFLRVLFVIFVNNALYLMGLVYLVVFLAGASVTGGNRCCAGALRLTSGE